MCSLETCKFKDKLETLILRERVCTNEIYLNCQTLCVLSLHWQNLGNLKFK